MKWSLIAAVLVVLFAGVSIAFYEQHEGLNEYQRRLTRLDAHCAFMKTYTQELVHNLEANKEIAVQGFSNLAASDLRELRLCVKEGTVDSEDRALLCSNSFKSNHGCMIHILQTALDNWGY